MAVQILTNNLKKSIQNQTFSEEQFLVLQDIENQYKSAMLALNSIGVPMLTIYGGARVDRKSKTYQDIFDLASQLGQNGWAVVTGGGPGVMEAALKGVKAGGGISVGFSINIPSEIQTTQNDVQVNFTQFAPRKYALRQADAFVFAPGGIGTLDELLEVSTLSKTNKFANKKVYLLDSKFWRGLVDWILKTVYQERELMNAEALTFLKVVDDISEIKNDLLS